MKKIPVLETIKAAYGFVFTHLGAIIGLIWLPMVLVTVPGFFVEQRYFDAAAGALADEHSANLGSVTLGLICFLSPRCCFTPSCMCRWCNWRWASARTAR